MSQVFQFAVIGLGAGSLYAIAAIGLVLVYRGSRVVNFAQGAMGMMAAYIFYELHQNWHLNVVIAIPAGLVVSGALGAAFYFLEMRRLQNASNLIKIVATLALFVIAQEVINLVFGGQPRIVNFVVANQFGHHLRRHRRRGPAVDLSHRHRAHRGALGHLQVHAVRLGDDRGGRESDCRRHPGNLARCDRCGQLGRRCRVGGLAAILLVPITTLSAENLSLIVIPILAAAVIGGFSSFPITTIAGLVLGIAESEVTRTCRHLAGTRQCPSSPSPSSCTSAGTVWPGGANSSADSHRSVRAGWPLSCSSSVAGSRFCASGWSFPTTGSSHWSINSSSRSS